MLARHFVMRVTCRTFRTRDLVAASRLGITLLESLIKSSFNSISTTFIGPIDIWCGVSITLDGHACMSAF